MLGLMLLPLHVLLFFVCTALALTVFIFNDTGSNFSEMGWWAHLLVWTAFSYPIVLIVSFILGKFISEGFILLPLVNLLVVVGFLVEMFVIFPLQSSNSAKKETINEIQKSSKDFTCEDASFFSIKKTGDPNFTILKYYSSYIIKNPGQFYIESIGTVKESKIRLDIKEHNEKTTMPDVRKHLASCRNKEGKSLSDIYQIDYGYYAE